MFLSTLGPSLVAKADKESSCQCRRHKRCEFHPLVRKKIPWRRKWLPTPVFLPEKFHGPRSLVGYSLLGSKSQTRLSVSPLNLASQVFVLLLECYAFKKKKIFFFSSLNQSTSLFCFCEDTNFERSFFCSCAFISMTLWISAFLTSLLTQKLPFVFIVCTWTLKI